MCLCNLFACLLHNGLTETNKRYVILNKHDYKLRLWVHTPQVCHYPSSCPTDTTVKCTDMEQLLYQMSQLNTFSLRENCSKLFKDQAHNGEGKIRTQHQLNRMHRSCYELMLSTTWWTYGDITFISIWFDFFTCYVAEISRIWHVIQQVIPFQHIMICVSKVTIWIFDIVAG